jgi:hypothetical protein
VWSTAVMPMRAPSWRGSAVVQGDAGEFGGMPKTTRALYGDFSLNTIRTHVRGILEKAGCHRQLDIVALLTAMSSARPMTSVLMRREQTIEPIPS